MSDLGLAQYLLSTPAKENWKKTGTGKRSGVLVPLFSVYSRNSVGIGDLSDLKLLIDWAARSGNSIVQLLPMNEVGALSCPYESLSSFALEPAYISLYALPSSKDKFTRQQIENLKRLFPTAGEHVDYAIKREKALLLWQIYSSDKNRQDREFEAFNQENSYWLQDFALYKALKDYYQGLPWYEWDDKYRSRDKAALQEFEGAHKKEVGFQKWLQWRLWQQFKEAKSYAKKKKVLLQGDLPILVSRDSADVWQHQEFFKLDFSAGAPPDMYCAKGQRWGMPTYNWENIAADGFRYLKEKLRYARQFYDILRIDHVVGLFRIWSIPYNEPLENKGLNGFFDPRDEKEWASHGSGILLTILNNSGLLLCAEDLGVIPEACPVTLKEFGIPGNDIQRWTKDWKKRHDFLKAREYRSLSVAMLSTHDTTSWPAWWENEAGTVDEDLFLRRCNERGIDFKRIKDRLFDSRRSLHGRLRWLEEVSSAQRLVEILAEGFSPQGALAKDKVLDFIEFYNNSYQEKEKLWKQLGIEGPMREGCDIEILAAALRLTLESSAIFSINTIFDYLYLAGLLKGDPYQYRINTPGTVSNKNWSLKVPIPLEELLRHKVNAEIRKMISASKRA